MWSVVSLRTGKTLATSRWNDTACAAARGLALAGKFGTVRVVHSDEWCNMIGTVEFEADTARLRSVA
jgi:hypothetical protein